MSPGKEVGRASGRDQRAAQGEGEGRPEAGAPGRLCSQRVQEAPRGFKEGVTIPDLHFKKMARHGDRRGCDR